LLILHFGSGVDFVLPTEIWVEIFRYLEWDFWVATDLLKFRLISRQCRDAILQIPFTLNCNKKFKGFEGITNSIWIDQVTIWNQYVFNPSLLQFLNECKNLKRIISYVQQIGPDIFSYIPNPNALKYVHLQQGTYSSISTLVNLDYLR
jgi:hypothetical protein